MQTKSAMILGLSFVIGASIYAAALAIDAGNSNYSRISITNNEQFDLDSGMQISPEIYADLIAKSHEKAIAAAQALNRKLGKATDVYFDAPHDYYQDADRDEKDKKLLINVSITYELQ
ncbi:MAG: hypothetical protein LBI57_03520 [Helicobacteraceae bacterium]|jgi:hypothetical protein|nr:hypothetical protein [Helicobacteraceae bacterium]